MLGYAPPQGSSSKPQSHPFKLSDEGPVSFDFPTPSSPIYTHLKRYFQDNGWVLDISRTIMFSVSWFARNTAIVIYNNYFKSFNDNGSNKNEDT